MLKAEIKKGTPTEQGLVTITAEGGVPELLNDVALLIGGIYTQFKVADPVTAEMFRIGVTNMAMDGQGPLWNAVGSQTGIIIRKPEKED